MKKLLLLILTLGLIGLIVGVYYYFKPAQSVANEKPEFSISSAQLVTDYEKDENASNQKYLGKVIEIKGLVSEKSTDKAGIVSITLAGEEIAGVTCQMFHTETEKTKSIQEGDELTIKGRCTGILMDVVLVDCVINEKN